GALPTGPDVQDGHGVGHALEHVAVAGEDQRRPASLLLRAREGPERVGGLERVVRGEVPAERVEERAGGLELWLELVRDLRPCRVVWRVELEAIGGGIGAEAHRDRAWAVALHLPEDQVHGPEQ